MNCQLCLHKNAQFHIQKIVNNELKEIHLCCECASKQGSHEEGSGIDDKFKSLLGGLLRSKANERVDSRNLRCNVCETTIEDLKRDEILGCPHCFKVFSDYISETIKQCEGFFKNGCLGLGPDRIYRLQNELKKAVEQENFEKAARLRDEIRDSRNEGMPGDNWRSRKK